MVFSSRSFLTGLVLSAGALQTTAFDNSRSDNLAIYYGQNSYGATHGSDTANWQKTLSAYCQDDTINAIPLAFLNVFFSVGGLPEINMANTCNPTDSGVFSGTNLANCQFLAADIKACQAKGKIITLSLGGATGAATFSSDAQAQTFADTIWNLFLGGSSSTRPFGTAVLDGFVLVFCCMAATIDDLPSIDLDIEGGGSTGFAAFVTRIRSHASGASKPYYVTAAPQCVFPDAYLGTVLNAVAFDAIYVQHILKDIQYNNFCGVQNYNNPNAWNFNVWDNWAKTGAINKNVKIYIGAPAASTAAGSGYVDAATLGAIAKATRSAYSSFGGIMLWDASQAYANGRYDQQIKSAMGAGGSTGTTTTKPTTTTKSTTSTTKTTSTTPTTTVGTGSCSTVSAWSAATTYVGGQQATYTGHLWYAQWWTLGDIPGGAAGVWLDKGACSSFATSHAAAAPVTSAKTTSSVSKTSSVAKPSSTVKASSAVKPSSSVKASSAPAKSTASAKAPSVSARSSRFFKL
ncbi:hypothetical protein DXG01_008076 [Tephrocybe rancida]|nr:hypothetical protein DXG01_008076 [Tephrocybe rancida]